MKLQTVNVIELCDDVVTQIFSYTDNDAGNEEAEKMFVRLAKKNYMSDDEVNESLKNGYYYYYNDYSITITHSS